jgi:hypothetical protein
VLTAPLLSLSPPPPLSKQNDGGAFAFLREVERQAMDMGRVGRRSLQALPTLNLNRTDCGQPMRIDIRSQVRFLIRFNPRTYEAKV